MSSFDASFFFLDWDKINELNKDFWEKYVDYDGKLSAECSEWIAEVSDYKTDIENWKVSLCANDAYEEIRMSLPKEVRAKSDLIFSKMFGYSSCDYWQGFEEEDNPYISRVVDADFNHCISPLDIKEILDIWKDDLINELSKVFHPRKQNLYISDFEGFVWHINGWIYLLKRAKSMGNWGIIISLAY